MSVEARLPDGRRVVLAPELAPIISCGAIVAESVTIGPAPALQEAMLRRARDLRAEYDGLPPHGIPLLKEARRLYQAAGMDPTRTRPSSEALLRRVLKNQPLPAVNNAVDAVNLASLSFLLPIGLYDLDRVEGDITARLGTAGEQYPGIRKDDVHLHGRLGLFDAAGPFGSPTSDSLRTSVNEQTERLLAVIFATASYPAVKMEKDIALLSDLLRKYCAGEITARLRLARESRTLT